MRAHSGGELKLQGPRVKQATRDSRATVEEGVSEIGSEIELAVGSYTKNGIYLKEPVKKLEYLLKSPSEHRHFCQLPNL